MKEKKSWQEVKTTALGVIAVVFSGLVLFGVVTPEQQADAQANFTSLGEAITAAVVAISGIINIFRAK